MEQIMQNELVEGLKSIFKDKLQIRNSTVDFLKFNEADILQDKGKVTAESIYLI